MTFQIREAVDGEARNEVHRIYVEQMGFQQKHADHAGKWVVEPLAAVARDLCDNNMFGGEDLIRRLSLASEAEWGG